MKSLLAALFVVVAGSSTASAEIFKYRDGAGQLVFTNHALTDQEAQQRGLSLYGSEASTETAATKSSPMPAPNSSFTSDADLAWLASSLINDYRGRIGKIEKLTSSTCWAILEPGMTVPEVMKTTGLICEYIRNASGRKVQPNVHTFQGMTHMAVAKPPDCTPELKIEKW